MTPHPPASRMASASSVPAEAGGDAQEFPDIPRAEDALGPAAVS